MQIVQLGIGICIQQMYRFALGKSLSGNIALMRHGHSSIQKSPSEICRVTHDAGQIKYLQGTQAFEDMEVLLKVLEIPLPDGNERHNIQIRWCSYSDNSTYRDIAMVPEGEKRRIYP